MHQYKYTALEAGGKRTTGELAANSAEAAEAQLMQKNLFPTKLELITNDNPKKATNTPEVRKSRKKVSVDDICEMLRAITVMAQSGVPVGEGLQTVAENATSAAVQDIARALKNDVMSGRTLSQAMAAHPRAFPKVVVDMIAIADEGGRLADTLENVVVYMDKTNAVRKNVVAALTYPGILMGGSLIAFLALIVVVLPTFNEAFSSLGVKLPMFTMILLSAGIFIKSNFLLCIAGVIGSIYGFKHARKNPKFDRLVRIGMIKVPIVGPILTTLAINRSLRTLGSLLKTNVPIIDALTYSGRVANHIHLEAAFEQVKVSVGNGSTLAEAFSATKQFPKMVIQMVSVGERSGRLSELLFTITEHSEAAAERKIKSAVSLLEPAVIVGMGVLVGMITMSILMPLFSLSNNIN
jgi:type II secretory pathway component PulF